MSLLKEDKVAPELGMGGKNSKTQRRFYKSPSTKSSVGGGGGMGADLDHTRGAPFMPAGNNAFLTQEINNSSTKKILKNKRQSVNPSLPSLDTGFGQGRNDNQNSTQNVKNLRKQTLNIQSTRNIDDQTKMTLD